MTAELFRDWLTEFNPQIKTEGSYLYLIFRLDTTASHRDINLQLANGCLHFLSPLMRPKMRYLHWKGDQGCHTAQTDKLLSKKSSRCCKIFYFWIFCKKRFGHKI